MKKITVSDSKDPSKQTSSSLSTWRVLSLPYPRERVECSYLHIAWVNYWKIKLPHFSLKKRSLEKPGPSVDYDLLCQELESILSREEKEGYELVSIHPTHAGSYSVHTIPKRPNHQFLRTVAPSHQLQSKEALLLIFRASWKH